MKRIYFVFMAAVQLVAVTFGLYSLIDKDDECAVREPRSSSSSRNFPGSAFADGSYMVELEDYYADQFPLREKLLSLDSQLNRFYNASGGDDGTILIETTGNAGAGGIGGVQQDETAQQEETPQEDGTSTGGETPQEEDTPSEGTADQPQEETPDEAPDTEEEDPPLTTRRMR